MESEKLVVATREDMKDLFENKGKFYNENTLIKYYEELYKIDEENLDSLSVFKVDIRHPEKDSGYKLPDGEMITIEQIYEQAKKYDDLHLKKENKTMEFKDMKELIDGMIKDNYKDFVKALISVEKGVNNHEALNNLYEQFMENDGMNLLHEDFDYMIDELVNNGVIKENDKEVEISEEQIKFDRNREKFEGTLKKLKLNKKLLEKASIGFDSIKGKFYEINSNNKTNNSTLKTIEELKMKVSQVKNKDSKSIYKEEI